jgi:hypothetical protein
MGFRVAEATKAWCIRRKRGDELRRFLAPIFLPGFRVDWTFLVEDCAAAGATKGTKSGHNIAAVTKINVRIDCER